MLQTHKSQPPGRGPEAQGELVSGTEALQFSLGFIRRQYPVVLFVSLLLLALGFVYILTARPSYTAQAMLLIDSRKVQLFQQQSILGDIPIDSASVESQTEVLKSENIVLAVIKKLHLTEDPEFVGSGSGLLGTLFDFVLSPFDSEQAKSEFELVRQAVRTFYDRILVKRVGLSYVIQISFRSYDAGRAAEITNAIADAYIDDQLEAKYQAARRASVWLQDRIKELRDQVSVAERAVVDFKTKNNIVSTGGTEKRLVGEQQVAELNSQLVIARSHTAEMKARLDRIGAVLRADSPSATVDETVTDTLKSEVVSKLRSQYLELAAREADWSTRYGREHLATVNLRNQMRELRNSIFEELKRLGESYKSDYEIAKQREAGVRAELAQAVTQSQTTDSAQIALRELESSAQTYKTLYDNFLQRYMESVQQQSFPISEARLISQASRPLRKSHPQTLLVLAICGLGGVFIGFGVAMLRDLSDRVFRTSRQVEDILGTSCIALVPLIDEKGDDEDSKVNDRHGVRASIEKRVSRLAASVKHLMTVIGLREADKAPPVKSPLATKMKPKVVASAANASRTIVRDDSVLWKVTNEPFSRYAEGVRAIKLAADLNGIVKSNKVIGLTSSLPNEGKSTMAASLAQLISQIGSRTILVDCDLRNPSLTYALAPAAQAGILQVIAGQASLDDVIWKDPSSNLSFLPAVSKARLSNSSEILASDATKKLFEQLRQRYDYVVADFSPLAPVIDVRATTHLVDSYVFVIEWGRTNVDVVEHALGGAQGVYENLLGVVLNKVDMNVFGRYEAHRRNYYYNAHYSRYGYVE